MALNLGGLGAFLGGNNGQGGLVQQVQLAQQQQQKQRQAALFYQMMQGQQQQQQQQQAQPAQGGAAPLALPGGSAMPRLDPRHPQEGRPQAVREVMQLSVVSTRQPPHRTLQFKVSRGETLGRCPALPRLRKEVPKAGLKSEGCHRGCPIHRRLWQNWRRSPVAMWIRVWRIRNI